MAGAFKREGIDGDFLGVKLSLRDLTSLGGSGPGRHQYCESVVRVTQDEAGVVSPAGSL